VSNVLAFQENIFCYENMKVDIYAFFLNELNNALKDLNFDTTNDELIANYMDFFNNNLNRTLIKAIIMPLIYGKTSMGLVEDLKKIFEKGLLFPSNQILIRIANRMLSIFKQHPTLKELMLFMGAKRAFAALLFKCNKVIIRSPYHHSFIEYNKEEIQQIRIYFKNRL
jgi:hypothetical protein